MKTSNYIKIASACILAAGLHNAWASVANLQVLVASGTATGTTASGSVITLGTYAYDAANDAFYTMGYSSSGQLLKITKDSSGQYNQVEVEVSPAQFLAWEQSLAASAYPTATLGSASPTISGILVNPNGGSALLVSATNVTVNGTKTPSVSPRFYSYNLQQSQVADATDVFSSVATLGQINAASGISTSTATTTNISRQFAWAPDKVSVYYNDAASTFSGLYKLNTSTGAITKIISGTGYYAEVSTSQISSSVDRIYTNSIASGNTGGIDYVDYDNATSTASDVKTLVSAAAIKEFLELPDTASLTNVIATATDSAGNVYFTVNGGSTTSRALLKLDTEGRISKVLSNSERAEVFGSSIYTVPMRLQTRTTSYTNANGETFDVTQVMYAELTGVNAVAGAYVFKVGDYNLDNSLTTADLADLHSAIHSAGVSSTDSSYYLYDLNGNGTFSYKDIKIAQEFLKFGDADANLDGVVDFSDFQILQNNYGLSDAVTFIDGDFNGDGIVDFSDFQILQNSYGYIDSLLIAADATLDLTALPASLQAVPEPATAAMLSIGGALLLRRKKK